MIHHTCDRCRRVIDPEREARYEIRIEAQAIVEPRAEVQEPDDDRDYLQEIHQILEEEFNATVFDEPLCDESIGDEALGDEFLCADEALDDDCDEDLMSLDELTKSAAARRDESDNERRFDLCSDCFAHFMANPIGHDLHVQLDFSEN